MKIAVIGAGVVGVATAYELAADGHEVTVFERHAAAAEEASFANAGIVAPGHLAPWAVPPRRLVPARLGLPLTARELGWLWQWRRSARRGADTARHARLLRLALYSRERLLDLTERLSLTYDRSDGYLVLLRTEHDRKLAQPGLQALCEAGVKFHELDAQATRRLETSINPDTPLHSAVYLPDSSAGNCRQFTLLLKQKAQTLGARFEFNTPVTRIEPGAAPAVHLEHRMHAPQNAPRTFDAVVLCAGLGAAALLRPLGLRLPLAAVHGYSISAPIREPLNAPRGTVVDERLHIAITRLGQRVRVAGGAEIGGAPQTPRAAALAVLYKALRDWFPGAAQLSAGVQEWKGARPTLADGPPMLGASGLPGLWLNLGHGANGWALACGSAHATAALIARRRPALDLEGLGVERLTSSPA